MKSTKRSRYIVSGLSALVICMASGCATTDTVSSRFPELQNKINAAKAVDAQIYAQTPLKSAEAKLEEAKAAVQAGDMVVADKLVDEAMADAEYAKMLAPTEKAKSDAMKLRESIQAVRDEIKQLPAIK